MLEHVRFFEEIVKKRTISYLFNYFPKKTAFAEKITFSYLSIET